MAGLKMAEGTWVVVCDGAKALVLENVGDAKFPNLRTKEVFEEPHASTQEQGTDAPGRAHNSVGSARSAVEQTDWHDQAERQFLDKLLAHLDTALTAGETTALILVAPPRALGMLRHAYSQQIRSALQHELDKDLVKMPVHEIETYLVNASTRAG
jgi:protein required for attachment to host cells